MPDRTDELREISGQLSKLISKGSIKSTGWVSIAISLAVLCINLGLLFGVIQTKLTNHVDNTAVHASEQQRTDLTLNTQHRQEFSHENLNSTYTTLIEHKSLVFRVNSLEKTEEDEK